MGKRGPKPGAEYKSKPGPRNIILDEEQLKKLASINCTMEEIANFVGCSVDTLEKNYMEAIKIGRSAGRASLRRIQFEQAKNGNATMAIWLGKQLLGQRDRADLNVNLADDFINAIGDV